MTSRVHCFVGGLSKKKADVYYWQGQAGASNEGSIKVNEKDFISFAFLLYFSMGLE